jgi:cytochrome c peroxidase
LNAAANGLPTDDEGDLSTQLRHLIESKSQGQGLAFFRLPENEDLESLPQDPLNPIIGPKVTAGMYLFQEPGLAMTNVRPEGFETYSCGSCHPAHSSFFSNLPQGIGEGGSGFGVAGEGRTRLPQYDSNPDTPDVQPIRVPSIANIAYQEAVMWDGRLGGVGVNIGTEVQWQPSNGTNSNWLGMHGPETQVHAGMDAHRLNDIQNSRVATDPTYLAFFTLAFPDSPQAVTRINAALATAAFERTVITNQAPFQKWLRGQKNAMTTDEIRGAAIFFGKGGCVDCHTGPALNSMTFYAMGMKDIDGSYDPGRVDLAPFGGTVPIETQLGRGGFTGQAADEYKFKTPQLYNMKASPFYGHGSSFASVKEVVEYLNDGIPENPNVPMGQLATEFQPLGLNAAEVNWLTAFLEDALYDGNMMRYFASFVPTNLCFPSNDPQSQIDLGCTPTVTTLEFKRSGPRPEQAYKH